MLRFLQSRSVDDNITKEKIFDRRYFFIFLSKIVASSIIVFRLFFLQVFRSKTYKKLSERNQYRSAFIMPERGKILDRQNELLAYNDLCYKAMLDKSFIPKMNQIVPIFLTIIGEMKTSTEQMLRILNAQIKRNGKQNLTLKSFLTKEEIVKIEYNLHLVPGISVEKDINRIYPLGSQAAHIVGYLRVPSSEDVKSGSLFVKRIANHNYKIGHAGVEKSMNTDLCGRLGVEIRHVDAHSRVLKTSIAKQKDNGRNVKLTQVNYIVKS